MTRQSTSRKERTMFDRILYALAAARLLRGAGWSLAQIERQTQINEVAATPSEDTE